MKVQIRWVLILMGLCTIGISALQLYWNYENYERTVAAFKQNINTALDRAVEREIGQRHIEIAQKFKGWLLDTSLVTITCNNNNRRKNTVFHLTDTHPISPQEKGITIGISRFNKSLSSITPEAKIVFVNHFVQNILMGDLKKGIVYNYTPRLGDRLLSLYKAKKVNLSNLKKYYRQELTTKGIQADFRLDPEQEKHAEYPYQTSIVNTALNRPYEKEMIVAGFENPSAWFLKHMKWLLLTSVLLVGICLFCFGYTGKTLLSQHKLAVLKDDFIDNMTHELNTPIASIKLTTDALKTFNFDKKTQSEYLDMIGYQADKLAELSTHVLNTTDHNYLNETTQLALCPLIQLAIKNLEPHINTLNAQLNFDCSENFMVKGDRSALVGAITNIISNALKYSIHNPVIDIKVYATGKLACVEIADMGIGIPEVYREHIFEKFFRVPQGNIHNIKGYGLGLNYVRRVIEAHYGKVVVSPNTPEGTKFTIKIPLS